MTVLSSGEKNMCRPPSSLCSSSGKQGSRLSPVGMWKHHKGSLYTVVGEALAQTTLGISDYDRLVVYRAEEDGRLWVCPAVKFYDGRFTRVSDGDRNGEDRDSGLIATTPKSLYEGCERQAHNLANLWANGLPAAKQGILVALLKAAQHSAVGIHAETPPSPSPDTDRAGLIYWLALDAATFPILPEEVRKRMVQAALALQSDQAEIARLRERLERADRSSDMWSAEAVAANARAEAAEAERDEAQEALMRVADAFGLQAGPLLHLDLRSTLQAKEAQIERMAEENDLLRQVEAAARNLPRAAPGGGGASTVHEFKIEACHVWDNDAALRKVGEFRRARSALANREDKGDGHV